MTKTSEILNTARYIRNIRPVDPDEIANYIEDHPHPAVVRQTIRDHGYELDLRERPDGQFVPLSTEPIDPAFSGVSEFPSTYAALFEEYLVDHYGPEWSAGASGDRLRTLIDDLKAAYFGDEEVAYDPDTAAAYALYHLPDYYASIQYVLDDLARDNHLARKLRVLDVGAGPGGPALGIHDYLPPETLVAYEAIEPSAAAAIFTHIMEATRPSFTTTITQQSAASFSPENEYDIILFANVLSELDDPVGVIDRYLDVLAADGTVIALAPAEERTATRLRDVERAVITHRSDATVYAPTIRLWPATEPTDYAWSFRREPDIEPPAFQTQLDAAGPGDGTYINTDIQFAYLLLRLDGHHAIDYTPDENRVAKMAEMEHHVTDRIDIAALKLSPNLTTDGNPLFKVSDGSEDVAHYAVLTNPTSLNATLTEAPYGALLHFENVLVLWNEDEEAYNLVVDDETIIDRLA